MNYFHRKNFKISSYWKFLILTGSRCNEIIDFYDFKKTLSSQDNFNRKTCTIICSTLYIIWYIKLLMRKILLVFQKISRLFQAKVQNNRMICVWKRDIIWTYQNVITPSERSLCKFDILCSWKWNDIREESSNTFHVLARIIVESWTFSPSCFFLLTELFGVFVILLWWYVQCVCKIW